jgi:hypothetical protein
MAAITQNESTVGKFKERETWDLLQFGKKILGENISFQPDKAN